MSCNQGTDPEKYKELDEYIDSLPETKGKLISVLHRAQGIFGYLPAQVQEHVAEKLGIPSSTVYGVVTFYSYFTMNPKGKYDISVCLGTACFVRGADKILEKFKEKIGIDLGQTTEDGKFSLRALRCVGACGLAPVVMVGDKVYGRVTPESVDDILAECE